MAKSTLLVPMELEALMVNENGNGRPFVSTERRYDNLQYSGGYISQGLKGDPFPRESEAPRPGIHLHWFLPDALTKGVQTPEGDTEFPPLPTIWLVQRIALTKDLASLSRKGWLVESDVCTDEDTGGITVPVMEDGDPSYRWLGRCTELCGEDPPAEELYVSPLHIQSTADHLFNASYTSCKSVFGFWDSAEDLDPGDLGSLSYLVLGWYRDPALDLVRGFPAGDWTSGLQALGWYVENSQKTTPNDSIFHGVLLNLPWNGSDASVPYPTGVPKEDPEVLLAPSQEEAVAALLARRAGVGDTERLFTYLQAGTLSGLETPEGLRRAEREYAEGRFTGHAGEPLWDLRAPEREDGEVPAPLLLGAALYEKLQALNEAEHAAYLAGGKYRDRCDELYCAWYRYILESNNNDDPFNPKDLKPWKKETETLLRLAGDEQKRLAQLVKNRDAARAQLDRALKQDKRALQLVQGESGVYYRAKDPTLLLSGPGLRRSRHFGEDGRFRADGLLLCRTDGQVISGLRIDGREASRPAAFDRPLQVPAAWSHRVIADSLYWESLFVNDALTDAFCTRRSLRNARESVRLFQQNALRRAAGLAPALSDCAAHTVEYTGTYPSKTAVTLFRPPWAPLYIFWKVSYQSCPSSGRAPSLSGWALEGDDFAYHGAPPSGKADYLRSSIFLTPGAVQVLEDTLKRRQAETGSGVPARFRGTAGLDVLSQELSNFKLLLLHAEEGVLLPMEDCSPETRSLTNKVRALLGEGYRLTPTEPGAYHPLAHGFFTLDELWLVDAFGQYKEVPLKHVALAEGLKEPACPGRAALRPRLTLPCRLSLRLLGNGDSLWTGNAAESSPVEGFLCADFLNRALHAYAPDGSLLTTVKLIRRGGRDRVVSRAPKRTAMRPGGPGTLQALLDRLCPPSGDPADFLDFLDVLRPMEQRSQSSSDMLSCFAGRVLALLRAQVSLDLAGRTLHDTYAPGEKKDAEPLGELALPLHLGNAPDPSDGLAGYWTDGLFHPACGAPAFSPRGTLIAFQPDGMSLLPERTYALSLLADPTRPLHFASGILPPLQLTPPMDHLRRGLDAIRLSLAVAPILNPPGDCPLPVFGQGDAWFWESAAGACPLSDPESVPAPPPELELSEGWLVKESD